jgi:hypothetical protein
MPGASYCTAGFTRLKIGPPLSRQDAPIGL